jgi:hypothetical protein
LTGLDNVIKCSKRRSADAAAKYAGIMSVLYHTLRIEVRNFRRQFGAQHSRIQVAMVYRFPVERLKNVRPQDNLPWTMIGIPTPERHFLRNRLVLRV